MGEVGEAGREEGKLAVVAEPGAGSLSNGAAKQAHASIRQLTPLYRRFVACNEDCRAENWSSICRPSRAQCSARLNPRQALLRFIINNNCVTLQPFPQLWFQTTKSGHTHAHTHANCLHLPLPHPSHPGGVTQAQWRMAASVCPLGSSCPTQLACPYSWHSRKPSWFCSFHIRKNLRGLVLWHGELSHCLGHPHPI